MSEKQYFLGYPPAIQQQVSQLITQGKLKHYLLNKYPSPHQIISDKALFHYTNELKQRYLKNTPVINKALYKKQKDLVKNALGTHTFSSKNHGGKLKSSHEIAIAMQLKNAPEPLLKVLVVHELAHFKEKDHNKAFYNLCEHMLPEYHQLELDLRLFIYQCEFFEGLYEK
ncbi:hypothetical protein PULV_a3595 [Pseudoalteromonas ulvae UL12]|uniref:Metal-dependent hydrolase n=1 Tax=Pseudoalteromonas ulvae TaxID=107327 RepID=A0A244CRN2_PSEDV|nr:YgjP-like metallopeptidase domain-containing protein [Pseudoalteromonas ulvae]MBE0363385.1 hypothetical protein [Pseudoalteromonas ulvae UL12]OUL58272.1 metal-dependent hydrolase [Pseudoalteromonas ulvae]